MTTPFPPSSNMTRVGLQLFRKVSPSIGRVSTSQSRSAQLAQAPQARTVTPTLCISTPRAGFSTSTENPCSSSSNIQSLKDLEDLLNQPTYGNRGKEFVEALQLEYEFFKYNGQQVPTEMTDEMWADIIQLRTVEDRLDLYRYFQLKERYRHTAAMKSAKGLYAEGKRRDRATEEFGSVPDNLYNEKGLSILGPTETIVKRLDHTTAKRIQMHHLHFALNFGQPLVFDLSVNYHMSDYEGSCFLSQMKELYGTNRSHFEPFNIYLCNYNARNVIQRKLVDSVTTEGFLWNATPKCFSSVFPKEKIVYLSSQSRNRIYDFSHDAIYVMGGCVDSRYGKDEMSKIKELGVNHAYFEMRPYFNKMSRPKIPLNLIFNCLMDARDSPNWHHAFRHFPRRAFRYRERLMNLIKLDQEKTFVNRRSIFVPQKHDISNYELVPERFLSEERDSDDDGEDGGEISRQRDDADVRNHHQPRRFQDEKKNYGRDGDGGGGGGAGGFSDVPDSFSVKKRPYRRTRKPLSPSIYQSKDPHSPSDRPFRSNDSFDFNEEFLSSKKRNIPKQTDS